MAVIKCKMCGGDIALNEEKTFGTCEYCGSTMTLPKVSDDQRAALFNRGNHFRRAGEFDKALAIYENIVREDDTDAEAHWCCALCRFGIEYVEDPNTYEYIPTCHRASFDSFLEDVDYLAALENSDGITRRQYQKDGAKIAEVQKGILATSQNEEPFDVFICYKETDDNTKERTKDSLDAQEIYYQLTNEGYRVFFSRITLEDKAGAEYEPYIFAALNSAKVMVAIGSKPEYFNAVWVKNEWSRFLALMRKNRSKLLLPCYKGMDPYDLPEQLSVLQSYDMSKIGFMQDLIRGIKKVLAKDEPAKAQPTEQPIIQQVVQSAGGANLTAQLKRGTQALEDRDWAQASAFFDKALDIDAECAEAFFGKALAEAQCASADELAEKRLSIPVTQTEKLTACPKDTKTVEKAVSENTIPGFVAAERIRSLFSFDQRSYPSHTAACRKRIEEEKNYWEHDRLLSRAVRYAKGEAAIAIGSCRDAICKELDSRFVSSQKDDEAKKAETAARYAEEMQKAEKRARELRSEAEKNRLDIYEKACKMQEAAESTTDYMEAESRYKVLKGFKDSNERLRQCEEAIEKLNAEAKAEAKKKRDEAEAIAKAKEKKSKLIGFAALAALILAFAAYFVVTSVMIPSKKYKEAEALLASCKYDDASAAFEELGNFKDSKDRAKGAIYSKAEALLALGEYDEASTEFAELGDFKDSTDMVNQALYEKAEHYITDGELEKAIETFEHLGNYKDCIEQVKIVSYSYAEKLIEAGDNKLAALFFGKANDFSDAESRAYALWDSSISRCTLSAGMEHSVALKTNGTVIATTYTGESKWYHGQCDVANWSGILEVSAGWYHTLGLTNNHTVIATRFLTASDPVEHKGQCNVSGWSKIVSVAAGDSHSVGLRIDGTVVAAGLNSSGQCEVSDWTDIIAIAAGGDYTVGLKSDGTVVSTYRDDEVSTWKNIIAVYAGNAGILGLKSNGKVEYFGWRSSIEQCKQWSNIVDVAVGDDYVVGLKADGRIVVVGDSIFGGCDCNDWTGIVAVAAGYGHTLGLKRNGTVIATNVTIEYKDTDKGERNVSGWSGIRVP